MHHRPVHHYHHAPRHPLQVADSELLTEWERKRQEYKQRKRLGGSREKETLQRLARFQEQLKSKARAGAAAEAAAAEAEADTERRQQGAAGADAEGQTQEAEGRQQGREGDAGYSGKVREDIDHRAYMPGARAQSQGSWWAGYAALPARAVSGSFRIRMRGAEGACRAPVPGCVGPPAATCLGRPAGLPACRPLCAEPCRGFRAPACLPCGPYPALQPPGAWTTTWAGGARTRARTWTSPACGSTGGGAAAGAGLPRGQAPA